VVGSGKADANAGTAIAASSTCVAPSAPPLTKASQTNSPGAELANVARSTGTDRWDAVRVSLGGPRRSALPVASAPVPGACRPPFLCPPARNLATVHSEGPHKQRTLEAERNTSSGCELLGHRSRQSARKRSVVVLDARGARSVRAQPKLPEFTVRTSAQRTTSSSTRRPSHVTTSATRAAQHARYAGCVVRMTRTSLRRRTTRGLMPSARRDRARLPRTPSSHPDRPIAAHTHPPFSDPPFVTYRRANARTLWIVRAGLAVFVFAHATLVGAVELARLQADSGRPSATTALISADLSALPDDHEDDPVEPTLEQTSFPLPPASPGRSVASSDGTSVVVSLA
jgi:hypothetical protein